MGNIDAAILSVEAEFIMPVIDQLSDEARVHITAEACARPGRWRSAIRRVLDQRPIRLGRTAALQLARLLDQIGTPDDVPRLRGVARQLKATGEDADIGRRLSRRIAPRVRLKDLGHIAILIDSRLVDGGQVRKKVLALLCFIVSRPEMSATKEQVSEALWPDLDADAASNSLNQTVYFLRRVFDPGYREGLSVDYLHHDSEVLWLDSELVSSDSREVDRLLTAMAPEVTWDEICDLNARYTGQYALEFMYEDWALDFRNSLHARYLETVERFVEGATEQGAFDRAIRAARRAVDIDPSADRLEEVLIRLYRATRANAAAAEQYEHYSSVMRTQLGVEPPRLEDL
jgi:DNA-binding SARP family transcriptional activator